MSAGALAAMPAYLSDAARAGLSRGFGGTTTNNHTECGTTAPQHVQQQRKALPPPFLRIPRGYIPFSKKCMPADYSAHDATRRLRRPSSSRIAAAAENASLLPSFRWATSQGIPISGREGLVPRAGHENSATCGTAQNAAASHSPNQCQRHSSGPCRPSGVLDRPQQHTPPLVPRAHDGRTGGTGQAENEKQIHSRLTLAAIPPAGRKNEKTTQKFGIPASHSTRPSISRGGPHLTLFILSPSRVRACVCTHPVEEVWCTAQSFPCLRFSPQQNSFGLSFFFSFLAPSVYRNPPPLHLSYSLHLSLRC